METTAKMRKLYPSSAVPVYGVTTDSYNDRCPRYVGMSDEFPQDKGEFNELYSAIGRITEEKVHQDLQAQLREGESVEFEVPVRHELKPGWVISGRLDAIIRKPSGNVIVEVKSSISKRQYSQVILGGEVQPSHLTQLLTYMAMTKTHHGQLICSYLHFTKDRRSIDFETRVFNIRVSNNNIVIDGKIWPKHKASDCLKYYSLMISAVEGIDLPAKTMNSKACESCPFNIVCEREPATKQEFRDIYEKFGPGEGKSFPEPKIHSHDAKHRRKS